MPQPPNPPKGPRPLLRPVPAQHNPGGVQPHLGPLDSQQVLEHGAVDPEPPWSEEEAQGPGRCVGEGESVP